MKIETFFFYEFFYYEYVILCPNAWLAHINKSIAHVFVNMMTFQKYAIHSYGLTIYSIDLRRTYPVSKFVF